jgi:hypothetical protein
MDPREKIITPKLRDEMKKFDGLPNLVELLTAEIQQMVSEGFYEGADRAAKELVGIFSVLEKHRTLDRGGPIVEIDTENIKPKVALYLRQITKQDSMQKLFTSSSVHVNLTTLLSSTELFVE